LHTANGGVHGKSQVSDSAPYRFSRTISSPPLLPALLRAARGPPSRHRRGKQAATALAEAYRPALPRLAEACSLAALAEACRIYCPAVWHGLAALPCPLALRPPPAV